MVWYNINPVQHVRMNMVSESRFFIRFITASSVVKSHCVYFKLFVRNCYRRTWAWSYARTVAKMVYEKCRKTNVVLHDLH